MVKKDLGSALQKPSVQKANAVFIHNIRSSAEQLSVKAVSGKGLERLSGKKIDGLVILGMGGSNLPGEVLGAVRNEVGLNLPLFLWKDYGLPDLRGQNVKDPFYVFVSHSGNTEETLSGLKDLIKTGRKDNVATVTGGGNLKELSEKASLPHVTFETGSLTPRQDTGKMFFGLLLILKSLGAITKPLPDLTHLDPLDHKAAGRSLAKKLKNKLVVIYTDQDHKALGYLWKIKLNETSKMEAFNDFLPEMDHNEINGFEKMVAPTAAIFISGKRNDRLGKRFEVTQKVLKQEGVSVIPVDLRGKSKLEEIWNSIFLADWTSYFLAESLCVDPARTRLVEKLKVLMSKF